MVYLLRFMKHTTLLLSLFLSTALFAQDKQITFQKIGSTRTFSISLNANAVIKMIPSRTNVTPGKRYGMICGYTDSTICFKDFKVSADNTAKFRAIGSDKSLTREQKQAAFLKISYPDSINIPYDSIQELKISLWGDKKYKLRCIAATAENAAIGFPAWITFIELAFNNPTSASTDITPGEENAVKILIPVSAAVTAGSYYIARTGTNKKINTKKWKLKVS